MSDINQQVLEMKEQHATTWRNKGQGHWFKQLSEEMAQLGDSLIKGTEGNVDLQLQRIASIALNWLEMRESD